MTAHDIGDAGSICCRGLLQDFSARTLCMSAATPVGVSGTSSTVRKPAKSGKFSASESQSFTLWFLLFFVSCCIWFSFLSASTLVKSAAFKRCALVARSDAEVPKYCQHHESMTNA
eukprot:2806069-Rhodomonas_salina.1